MSETLATILEDDVMWHMHAHGSGDRHFPAKDMFEEEKALAVLLAHDVAFVNSFWWEKDLPERIRNSISVNVACNDVFAWGCSDAEGLPHEEIESVYRMWRKDPSWGSAVWCMLQRKQMPQKPVEDIIRKAGIWDLDSLKLGPNTQEAELKAWLAEAFGASANP